MQRVDTPSAISTQPSQEPAGTPGYFTKGDPAQSIPATVPGQDWFNSVQEELIAILTAAGITPDKASQNQVITALITLGLRAATTTQTGVAEIATQTEVNTGTDNTRIVTPLTHKTALDAALTGKQPVDATLTALAAIVTAADKLIYATGNDTFSTTTLTAFARTLLDDTSAATARATLGAQASDATLTALAAIVTAADKLIYATGNDTFSTTTLTAFARTLLDDVDAGAARATLKVSDTTLAAQSWVSFNGTGTVAIRASHNVSSITDIGTGRYRVNFTTALPSAEFAAVVTCEDDTGISTLTANTDSTGGSPKSTTYVAVKTHSRIQSSNETAADRAHVDVLVFANA